MFTNEKKTFTNSNLKNNISSNPVVSEFVSEKTNYNGIKNTPPIQNKFNNKEINVSPLIKRNVHMNSNFQIIPPIEESAREKALNLNAASFIPKSKVIIKLDRIKVLNQILINLISKL